MNLKEAITTQLKFKLLNKNIVILKGNTSEFISPKILNLPIKKPSLDNINKNLLKSEYLESLTEFVNLDFLTFNQYLLHYLYQDKNLDIDNIYLYNSNWEMESEIVHGNIKIFKNKDKKTDTLKTFDDIEKSEIFDFVNIESNDNVKNEDINLKLKSLIIEKINNEGIASQNLFILDLADSIYSDKNAQLDIAKLNSLIDMFTNEINQIAHKNKPSNFKLIILIKNDQIFNSILFNNNQEITSLIIPSPSLEERKSFFNIRGILFKKLDNKLITKKEIDDASAITNGLTFRELFQLEVFSNNIDNIKDFKELYRLCFFEKKESEWEKINAENLNKFLEDFDNKVKGQSHVGIKIKDTLIRSQIGLQGILQSSDIQKKSKPRGILFFAGPTGVGKTESAKALSEFIFNDPNQIIRFDMSEYNHEESDQKLLGAAPGYIGYEAGGTLTNSVLQKPFSILLFDEIEKANSKIFDKFLQILEDGRLTSSKGELVDFSETFIIFTSNIGASTMPKDIDNKKIQEHFISEVKKYFSYELKRPEILNRIGIPNIIPFNKITSLEIKIDIIKSKIKKMKEFLLKEKNIKLIFDDSIEEYYLLVANNVDDSMGARSLILFLETDLVKAISNIIFKNRELIENKLLESKDDDALVNLKLKYVSSNNSHGFKEEIF
ncbi:ATPase [Mycoplasmopsis maculosa]|uniref:ATPase n=1 Tax=Mycoplasmopsis maculosa TaxID=114885 RepID=A0A449B461_9BACT|nr:AAA family ATPase [Mycoplasmopsis maculosa]VEU75394.1 ATPase [Mycoplasmopsis maculosa]